MKCTASLQSFSTHLHPRCTGTSSWALCRTSESTPPMGTMFATCDWDMTWFFSRRETNHSILIPISRSRHVVCWSVPFWSVWPAFSGVVEPGATSGTVNIIASTAVPQLPVILLVLTAPFRGTDQICRNCCGMDWGRGLGGLATTKDGPSHSHSPRHDSLS